ncbi:MAG: FG-GAP-like repeat-containing protein [Flavobacteriales bacterium]
MRRTLPLLSVLIITGKLFAQTSFTSHPELLPYPTHSGNCMAVTDMNGDGKDDIAVLDNSSFLKVLYQNIDGTFAGYDAGMMGADQWGMAVADMDNDGQKDAFSGGNGDGQHYLRTSPTIPATAGTVDPAYMFMQNISIADINNDGWLDVFGCHDNAAPNIWINDGQGNLVLTPYIDFTTTPVSDMSGNYGSVFSDVDNDGDLDLYVAHCRQGVNDMNDPRRWNRFFVNDGSNNYSDETDDHGLTDHYQSWCVDFGDWDNDGDMDLVVMNHDHIMQLFENDGTGHFTEIADGGLNIVGFLLQSHFEDFDNDGFLDILITGGSQFYLKGNGDGTFTPLANVFPNIGVMHGFAIGDLNSDGFMDIWANYGSGYTTPTATPDALWLNDGNANHWLNVRLQGVQSNRDGVGARVTVTGSPLGTQIREVRAGESYGLTNTGMCHFGMGTNTGTVTVAVHWPSGQVDTYDNVAIDQQITLVEGQCIAPVASITSNASLFLCPVSVPVTLTGEGGSSYEWNTGEATASISAIGTGYHTVTVNDGNGCSAIASAFTVPLTGIEPLITADGDPAFCAYDSLTLTSTLADTYLWSNGATTPSITVHESGNYTVTVDAACPDIPSAPFTAEAIPAPPGPTASNVSIPAPGTAELTATGDDILWYAAEQGGAPIGSGNSWTTPSISANSTYWCAEAAPAMTDTIHGGMEAPTANAPEEGGAQFFPIFECYSPFVLKSVLVHAQFAGIRTVALVNYPSNITISSADYNLPAGDSRIQLNMSIMPGTYGLRMVGDNIGMTYEYVDGDYPYALGDVGAIISTTNGGSGATAYYEIFYDWEVLNTTYGCESLRTPVQVLVGPLAVNGISGAQQVSVYPVPAHDAINIDISSMNGAVQVELMDIAGRIMDRTTLNGGSLRTLDVSRLAPGEYHLRIQGESGSVMRRIVVQ